MVNMKNYLLKLIRLEDKRRCFYLTIHIEWDEKEMKYKIVGYKNIDRLKRKLRNYGCVFMKLKKFLIYKTN